ncbi:MAG: lantibiotic biosynthesis protein, partial [Kribbellaceae bacterium]|nr:lantibiotic biosynthesis protein [Kribbellaceae bacterium]
NLSHSGQMMLLRDELRKHPATVLVEPPGGDEYATGWLGDRANEIIVQLTHTGPQNTAPRQVPEPALHAGSHFPPGDEWLYAKLYLSAERQDDLLVDHVGQLARALPEQVDRWFFIRYNDPEPHLRLRFHAAPGELSSVLLPALAGWAGRLIDAGSARVLMLDTYRPEIDRYGGVGCVVAAEQAFGADSDAVLTQLGLLNAGQCELDRQQLVAANFVDILRRLGDDDWAEWLLEAFPRNEAAHRATKQARAAADGLIDPSGDWRSLRSRVGGDKILASWERRADALSHYGAVLRQRPAAKSRTTPVASLLHMHYNRLIGPDREGEMRTYAIVRAAVAAHLARVRHTR